MPRRPTLIVAAALGLALASAGAPARAADDDPNVPRPRPTPPDPRSFRPTLALQYGFSTLYGFLEEGRSQKRQLADALVPSLRLALPVSRSLAVEAVGLYGVYQGEDKVCPSCEAQTVGGGLGLVYHSLEGAPFDPWFSAGAGLRRTRFTTPDASGAGVDFDYTGVDVLRLSFGADYYLVNVLGVGPYVEGAVGRFVSRSPGGADDLGTYGTFGLGLRLVLNPFAR
ncbi:MAG TPA: hypothetical protein VFS00_14945 [Polyangiaceae bacterium]|nr:hypothetical protein [Polyangiaceae bacterium]